MTPKLTKRHWHSESLKVEVVDDPGPGGASCLYEVTGFDTVTNRSRDGDPEYGLSILFQNGPPSKNGVNGITHEVLIAVCADRLRSFQAGPYACEENAVALAHLEAAQQALLDRTRARIARGVEGVDVEMSDDPAVDSLEDLKGSEDLDGLIDAVMDETGEKAVYEFPPDQYLPRLVTVDGKFAIPLPRLLKLSPVDMMAGFITQASWQATIIHQAELAEIALEQAERRMKEVEATAGLAARSTLFSNTGKVPAAAMVTAHACLDPAVKEAYTVYFKWRSVVAAYRAAKMAINTRKEMLINLGADLRIERRVDR